MAVSLSRIDSIVARYEHGLILTRTLLPDAYRLFCLASECHDPGFICLSLLMILRSKGYFPGIRWITDEDENDSSDSDGAGIITPDTDEEMSNAMSDFDDDSIFGSGHG